MSQLTALTENIPYNDPVVEKRSGLITDLWARYFGTTMLPRIDLSPQRIASYEALASNVAVAITALVASATAGKYRYSHYLQCVTPGGVSSAFQVTLTWTVNGIVQTQVFGNVNGNLTTTHEGAEYTIRVDGGSPVSISVTYASNPAGAATYDYSALLELVQADYSWVHLS